MSTKEIRSIQQEIQSNENHQGLIFKDFVKENQIRIRDVAKILGKSEQVVYNIFKSKQLSKELICLLHNLFGISYQELGEDAVNFTSPYVEYKLIKYLSYPFSVNYLNKSYIDYIHKYYTQVEETLKKMNNKVSIFDHLGNNSGASIKSKIENENSDSLTESVMYEKSFHQRYEQYLNKFEQRILEILKRGDNFSYTRIFQVPTDIIYSQKELTKKFIESLYRDTLEHLLKLFVLSDSFQEPDLSIYSKEIKNYYKKHKKEIKGKLTLDIRIIPEMTFNSFMIIDENNLITEYNMKNLKGDIYPDALFIEYYNNSDQKENQMNLSKYKVDSVIKSQTNKYSLLNFKQAIQKTLEAYDRDKIYAELKQDNILKEIVTETDKETRDIKFKQLEKVKDLELRKIKIEIERTKRKLLLYDE